MKWALELKEFEVVYRPQIEIKGHAIVDFLVEFTYLKDPIEEYHILILPPDLQLSNLTWVLYIDGSFN